MENDGPKKKEDIDRISAFAAVRVEEKDVLFSYVRISVFAAVRSKRKGFYNYIFN